ncbi:putative RNA-directed DNA polymerase [Helianthus annuus]|nr:putative RNA-directed DNA polymerase [Helianthus annuus]
MWNECVLTATYIINRIPSSILAGKSPYELLFKTKPSLLHLRSFGCLGFCTNLNPLNKFDTRSIKCVFIGYSIEKKGYKMWDLEKRTSFFSRDVKFYEDIFPFKQKTSSDSLEGLKLFDTCFENYEKNKTPTPDDEGKVSKDHEGHRNEVQQLDTPAEAVDSETRDFEWHGGETAAEQPVRNQTSDTDSYSDPLNQKHNSSARDTSVAEPSAIPRTEFTDPEGS